MFVKGKDKSFVTVAKGVQRKVLACGEKSLMTNFVLEEGAILPSHSHPHEQIGYLLSGRMVFTVNGQQVTVEPGDSWAIPGGVEHEVRVLAQAELIEVFVPIREEFLEK